MPNIITLSSTADILAAGYDPTYFLPKDPDALLRADPARRTGVTFPSRGVPLAGHLYRPPGIAADAVTTAVVLTGPISSVKEQTVPHYAERLSAAGHTVLTFDPRTFGESEGGPRAHHDPTWIIEDISAAVDHLRTRPDIDADRIAGVGVCMGGGYMLSAAARDRRIKVITSIAGGYNIGGTFQQVLGPAKFADFQQMIITIIEEALTTGKTPYMPTIAQALSAEIPLAAMPNPEAYSYYDRTSKEDAPTWSRELTVASLIPYLAYNSLSDAALVTPTPLQIIHGTTDVSLLPEYAQAAYDAAQSPKSLTWIETHNHIELYDQDPYVTQAAETTIAWLEKHL